MGLHLSVAVVYHSVTAVWYNAVFPCHILAHITYG